MIRQGWLRPERVKGLFRGGWRYRDAFLERKIWSNFPEAEEDYTLELVGEAIADLPRSVVRQLEPGDRVQLAGRRLQVLQIDEGERKRVAARPVDLLDEKELFWLGTGFQVSYEVAHSMREVLRQPAAQADGAALGLFTRTRRLLLAEREQAGRTVVLANGIEVGRSWDGLYRYRTFLGAVGNLILQWTIEHELAAHLEDLTVAADEVGLACSHWIDFRALRLPLDRAAFRDWTDRHLPALRALFPLNAFCAALPRTLLVEELTGFLFDPRLADVQRGFPVILTDYDRNAGWVHLRSRQGRLVLNKRLRYSLEEDLTDWNAPRLNHAARTVFAAERPHPLADLLAGGWTQEREPAAHAWVQQWLRTTGSRAGLNPAQQHALALPFQYRLSLVEGPPGTGKTHLLAWTLIALVQRAQATSTPLRIAVSALTHQAIDQVLTKVADLVNRYGLHDFPGRCLKWGRPPDDEPAEGGAMRVEPLTDREELAACRYPILGATGFGLYRLFEGQKGTFPPVFDWVIFDEASQVLIPQALLSLLYATGNVLFTGDVHQLPPIVLGAYEEAEETGVGRSILAHLLHRYGPAHRVRLDQTIG